MPEAHHIVAGMAEAAAPARNVLEKFGIGINDAENGVFLPGPSVLNPMGAAFHRPLHSGAYYRTVNDILDYATTRQEAIDALNGIKQMLLTNKF